MSRTPGALLLLLLVAVSLLPQAAHSHDIFDKSSFLKHYAKTKVLSECFGKDIVRGWHQWLENIMIDCHKEHEKRVERSLTRDKRNARTVDSKIPFYTADKVRFIKDEMMHKVNFINCTMNKMNLTITSDGEVDSTSLMKYYEGLELNTTLKQDLLEGLTRCSKASVCGDVTGYGPIDVDFQKKVKYLKCEQRCKIISCVKQDLRQYKDQFEFEGLDGILDDVQDDVDKMLAITSAKVSLIKSHLFF